MDYDEVLKKCGNYGIFQWIVLMCYAASNLMSSLHYFSQTIITLTPNHWCHNEQFEYLSTSEINGIFAAFQIKNHHCTPITNVTNGFGAAVSDAACNRWIYHRDMHFESITTELNWVCDDAYKGAVGQSLFFIGACVGTIGFGIMADRIGRMPTLLLSTLTGGIGDFMTSFASSLPMFAFSRFVSGLSCDTGFYMIYILAFEYLSPEKRTFGLNIITAVFYCLFTCVSPWVAVWIGNWRRYILAASIPAAFVLLYPLFICESAHWLITKKRYEKAVQCLKKVAKWNKKQVEEQVFEDFISHYKNKALEEEKVKTKKRADTFLHMFRTPLMRKKTIILILKSVIVTLTFDIVSRNVEDLGIAPFKLFSYSALAYFPGGLTIILLQNIIGRKGMAFLSLAGGAVITATTGYLIAVLDREANATLLAIMVGLGRYAVIVAYDAEVMYAAELLPTSVRGQGISVIHVAGYGFTFLSPYVIYLGNFYKPLPSFLIAFIMLIGAFLCLLLPETLNKKLPETVKDFETFGEGDTWWNFPCLARKAKDLTQPKREEQTQDS